MRARPIFLSSVRRSLRPVAAGAAVWLCLSALAAGCAEQRPTRPPGKVRVVATIFPLADVARQVAGPDADVRFLVKAGVSPHDYRPSAQDAETVARADILLMVGLGLDDWAERQAEAAGGRVRILRMGDLLGRSGLPAGHEDERDRDSHSATAPAAGAAASLPTPVPPAHDEHGEHHEHADPHVWLDPVMMDIYSLHISNALEAADPPHLLGYRLRQDEVRAQLWELHQEYRDALAGLKNRNFVTFHRAFGYIAGQYGLNEMSLTDPNAGGFGPERLEKVVRFIKDNKVKAIFVEPQFPAERLRELAAQAGVQVGRLDPEGNPGVRGYDTYQAMMRSNLAALLKALKE